MDSRISQTPYVISQKRDALRREHLWQALVNFFRKLWGDKWALGSFVFLLLIIICVFFPTQIAPTDPLTQNLRTRLLPPGTPGHLLGTDSLGRDVLSRIIFGSRGSLSIMVSSVGIAMLLGVPLGLVSGYYMGKTDAIIMRIVDVQMVFSSLLMIMVVVVMIGPGIGSLILVMGIATWVVHARVVRGGTLSLRRAQFVQAAQAMGAKSKRVIFLHILPNLISLIISMGILEGARIMVAEASLSFLGFGVQPPEISWGLIVSEGRANIQQAWWVITFPGLTISLTVLALNLLGNWLKPGQKR